MKMKKNLIDYELLWEKITDYAKATGRTTARPVLLLYYVLRSPTISAADKSKIYGALGYFILPTDLVLDFIPMMGYTDDMAALLWALHTVINNLTPEIKQQAKDKLTELMGKIDEKQIDDITEQNID